MAIKKTAKNLYVIVKGEYTGMSKTFYETAGGVEIVATKGNLGLGSNKKVCVTGKKS